MSVKRRQGKVYDWTACIASSGLESTTKHVLQCIASHMNAHGESCFPTVEQISWETSLTTRCVIKHTGIAVDAGWLLKSSSRFRGQAWRNNEYSPSVPEGVLPVAWKESDRYKKLVKSNPELGENIEKGGEPHSPPSSVKILLGGEPDDKGGEPRSPQGSIQGKDKGNPLNPQGGTVSSFSKDDSDDVQRMVLRLYGEILPELPQPNRKIWKGSSSYSTLATRIKVKQYRTEEFWRALFESVRANDWWFNSPNRDGWTCDLHWILKKTNFEKALNKALTL